MIRLVVVSAALVFGLVMTACAAPAAQAPAEVTAADAAPFIGTWTLALTGQNGPQSFDLTVKMEKDKVVGEIADGMMAAQPITSVTKADKSLVFRYSFDYQGTPIDVSLSLTPAPESKMSAQMVFAGGAFVMSGTATRKPNAQ